MKLKVDISQRLAKARAHTATHLLHAELDKLLNWTKQAWSLVDEDYLRFDFSASSPLSIEQIEEIEKRINYYIFSALKVEKIEMSFDEAIKLWAKAFFDEKYENKVRVVIVKSVCESNDNISIELCWGTHVENTADIGAFKIIWQEAVSSGIRRIIAITWPKVAQYAINQDKFILQISKLFDASPKQLIDKISKFKKEFEDLKNKYQILENQIIENKLQNIFVSSTWNNIFDKIVLLSEDKILDSINFKQLWNIAKNLYWNINFLIYNKNWNFFAYAGKKNINLKDFLKDYNLRWGGNESQIQWKDPNIINLFDK